MLEIAKEFEIFTDGACKGNPGKGAYSYIILEKGEVIYRCSEGFLITTNNRMELMGIINSLKYLKSKYSNFKCNIYSDSKYVTDAFNQNWITNWVKKNFVKVKNVDLWKEYLKISTNLDVKYFWVKGHTGVKFNEECDKMSTSFINKGVLGNDVGYCN